MMLGIGQKIIRICALLMMLHSALTVVGHAADSEETASFLEDDANSQLLESRGELGNRMLACQRFNYEYRQCVAAGCLFDGRTGACYGRGNPGPMPPHPGPQPQYCSQFNYDQYQCNRAGCYFDHRSGVCFDGGNYPPTPPGYRILCIAVDAGFEEHSRGHMGIGHNRYAAEQAAMGDCLRFHGRCRIRECRQQ